MNRFQEEMEEWKEIDHHNPVCPHCFTELEDAWELEMSDGDACEVECGNCDKRYKVSCYIQTTYTSRYVEADND